MFQPWMTFFSSPSRSPPLPPPPPLPLTLLPSLQIDDILEIADKKPYLPEVCYETVISLLEAVPKKIFLSSIFPKLKPKFEVPLAEYSPELLSLLFSFRRIYNLDLTTISSQFGGPETLNPAHLHKLIPALAVRLLSRPFPQGGPDPTSPQFGPVSQSP